MKMYLTNDSGRGYLRTHLWYWDDQTTSDPVLVTCDRCNLRLAANSKNIHNIIHLEEQDAPCPKSAKADLQRLLKAKL